MMSTSPFFTIVMSSYNDLQTIDEAVTAVLNQEFLSYEFFLVSDGSNDGTKDKMIAFQSKSTKIQVIESEINIGQSLAKNMAILRAQGKFIAIADADDIWDSAKLSKQHQYLIENPDIDVLGGQMIRFGDWGRSRESTKNPIRSDEISERLKHKRNPMNHPTVVFRKEAFLSVGGYRGDFKRNADLDLFMRMHKKGFKFANLSSVLTMYRTASPIQNFKYWVRVEIQRWEIILANSNIFIRFFPILYYPVILFSCLRLIIVYFIMKRKSEYVD